VTFSELKVIISTSVLHLIGSWFLSFLGAKLSWPQFSYFSSVLRVKWQDCALP